MTTPDERTTVEPQGTTSSLEELKEVRRNLQEAGLTLLEAATAAINAAAKDTLGATVAVLSAAEGTLAAAQEKLRSLRERVIDQAPASVRPAGSPALEEQPQAGFGVSSPG